MLERLLHIRFVRPEYLLLLVLIPGVYWMARRSIAGLGRVRGRLAIIARTILLAALAMALAGAQHVRVREDMAVAFVVDRSLSVPDQVQDELLDHVAAWNVSEGRRGKDKVALITFGENAAIDQPFTSEKLDTVSTFAVIEPGHTNIAAAIRAATASMPEAGLKRIVLISDGNENNGAAAAEAAAARAAGVRIDCLPVRYGYTREVMIEKLLVPPEVAPGKTIEVRVIVRAYAPAEGMLRLYANGVPISSQKVTLKPGINAFSIERTLEESGVYDFEASIECAEDTMYQNNRATAFSVVRGPKKVLVVEGAAGDGETLAQALRQEKVAVDRVDSGMLPDGVAMLASYDTVVLVNVAAYDLPQAKIALLATAVKEYGLGLVMVGGEDSFGAGGWRGSAVEEAMPVEMDVKDRQVVPSGALVLINHSCEFSDGNRWGIEISKSAMNTLGKYDEFGVLYYDYQMGVQWMVELAPVTDRRAIRKQLEIMSAGDMPSFTPTLQMAHAALKDSEASVKHIIIISDGDPQPPPPALLQRIVADGITISTVIISPHNPANDVQAMKLIARVGKGRFYYPRNARQLPAIFIKEARTVRRGLISERAFMPSMVLSTVPLTGFSEGDFPQLKGYVITTGKLLAEIPLVTASGDPLLAHWQYGLGRTVAFTSDAKAKWADEWVSWANYSQFWGQVVEWAERKVQTGDFTTHVSVDGDRARVSLDAIDDNGDYIDFLQFDGSVMAPSGSSQELSLEQTAPGHYEGTFKVSEVGTYLPLLKYIDSEGKTRMHLTPVTMPFSPEYKALSTNDVLLGEIAEIGGGEVIGPETDVFRRDFEAMSSYTDVWQWVLVAAVLVFLADVFVRRVILDYDKVLAWVKETLSALPWLGRLSTAKARQPAYTSRLLSAKKSAISQHKFEAPQGDGASDVSMILEEQTVQRARRAAEKRAEAPPVSEVAGKEAPVEETFTGRLLAAKKRAREEREKNNR